MVRPRLHAQGMSKPLSFRLAPPDRQVFDAKVKASGLTKSEFFRECVLTNATQVQARPALSAESKLLAYHMAKIGNNINQLARRANSDNLAGILHQDTYDSILHTLENIGLYMGATVSHAD